jgi:NAD(P)-dependent dehydrogenase (short-subunit alcohol dehydrogenase family)
MDPKIVLITGCSSGLGFAMTQAFLNNGWKVLGLSRQSEHPHSHPLFTPIMLDIGQNNFHAIHDMIAPFLINGLDLLINNAGFAMVGALESLEENHIRLQMDVNFFSHVLITKACLSALRQRRGKIFTISSIFGLIGFPFHSLYCASKFALEGFSEALHYELHGQGIQCTVIEPGRYKTEFGNRMQIVSPTPALDKDYQSSYKGFLRLKHELSQKLPNEQTIFAKKICMLASMTKVPVRLPIDRDSKLPYLLKKYLPSRLFAWLQYKMLAKYFYAPV